MKHTATLRSVSSRLLVAVVLGAAAFGLAAPSAHAGDAACTTTPPFKNDKVKVWCGMGGRTLAKARMQTAKKAWEKDGKDWKCKTCHDASTYKFENGAAQQKASDDIAKYLPALTEEEKAWAAQHK